MTERAPDRPTTEVPAGTLPRLALRPKDAAWALSIGERKLWELTADQTSGIPHVRFGKAIVYPVRELADWLAEQAQEEGGRP